MTGTTRGARGAVRRGRVVIASIAVGAASRATEEGSLGARDRRAQVLVAEDEPVMLRAIARVLGGAGYDVTLAPDGAEAIAVVRERAFDVIITDIEMPGADGITVLRAVRERDLDVPVVVVTGAPSLQTSIQALEEGALRYLVKPFDLGALLGVVAQAVRLHAMARVKRAALAALGTTATQPGDRAGLEVSFGRVLTSFWMAYQPIVRWSDRRVFAYEALLRSTEPTLPHPGAVLDAAERLGRLPDLGRAVRASAALALAGLSPETALFVNIHPRDLADDALFDAASPLARGVGRVVLEVTERSVLDEVRDVRERVARLRALGFRIALDDLGAGYAGLTSFAQLEPEVVKLDMALVRDVHRVPTKRRLVRAMLDLCREMGILVVAEGVETVDERDALVDLGCDLLQGYHFARPGPPFPGVDWGPRG